MRIPIVTMSAFDNNRKLAPKQTSKSNFMQTCFKAVDVGSLKKMPLENRLTHLFTTISPRDLVVVGKNVQEIQAGLKRTLSTYQNIIERILFLFHGGISVPLAFSCEDGPNNIFCTNIGEKPIIHSMLDDMEKLEPNSSCTLHDGDVLVNKSTNIPIDISADFTDYIGNSDDMEIVTNPESYANKVCDLTEVSQKWVKRANSEAISRLDKEGKLDTKNKEKKGLSFKDIGGLDKTIETLKRSILYPIKYPFAYDNLSINRGFLLHGKPGTGKTLIAEALASESDAHFIKLCGTDLESKWVGETEENWRNTFAEARDKQPSIIFIDEFDAIVKERGVEQSSHSDKTVNQILSLMSDLEKSDDKIFVIATTNKPETIDSAILRSGRFGKQIEVTAPDRNGQRAILKIHTNGKNIDPNLDIEKLLDSFEARNYTGADIKHITNEAHTNSWVRAGIYDKMDNGTLKPEDMYKVKITNQDFDLAISELDKNQKSKERRPIGYNK